MSQVVSAPGKLKEYISNIEFSLNFEDKKPSVKVRVGDIVRYDGNIAHYTKFTGEEVSGRTISLRSAVSNNWLTLKSSKKPIGTLNVRVDKMRDFVEYKDADYDPLKGGAFDQYLKNDPDTVVADYKIIREEDQVVKRTTSVKKSLEIVPEQTIVNSSTSKLTDSKVRKVTVIQADDVQGDRVVSKTMIHASSSPATKKSSTFTVDSSTPKLPEDFTINEVRRAIETVKFDGSSEGVVVKKVGEKGAIKMAAEPEEQEGVVLKKTDFSKRVASGSTPVMDLSEVKSQQEVDQLEKDMDKKASGDYLKQLPDNWGELHWTKKEKFVMRLSDQEFVKFIMTVETTKAVINACKTKLSELQKTSG